MIFILCSNIIHLVVNDDLPNVKACTKPAKSNAEVVSLIAKSARFCTEIINSLLADVLLLEN